MKLLRKIKCLFDAHEPIETDVLRLFLNYDDHVFTSCIYCNTKLMLKRLYHVSNGYEMYKN